MSGSIHNETGGQAGDFFPAGVLTTLFTDIVDSTPLRNAMPEPTSEERDGAYNRQIKAPHDAMISNLILANDGRILRPTGDGFCSVFANPERAVLCAVAIQEQLAANPVPTPVGPLKVRIGIHTGHAVPSCVEVNAVTGHKASRIQNLAEGGQVLVSRETHALVRGKLQGFAFASVGICELKGMEKEELFLAFRAGQSPAADAEERYRQHIIERFGKLTLYSVTSDKPLAVNLEQVFVKLTASQKRTANQPEATDDSVPPAAPSASGEKRDEALDGMGAPVAKLEAEPSATGKNPPAPEETSVAITLNEALREHPALAVLGGPGSGKTTLLKYLALSFARRLAAPRLELDEERLPLYVTLRNLNKWLDAQDKEYGLPYLAPALLAQYLTETVAHLFPSLKLPAGFFLPALTQGKCVVFLDGLDEIADATKRVRAAQFVAACLEHYAGNRFILTSRPRGYETACRQLLSAHCAECNIRDLDDEQIQSYAQSWYRAVTIDLEGDNPTSQDLAARRTQDLLDSVKTPRVRPLATNPLLLSILALIHQRGQRLPQRRIALYQECVEFLLGYWRQVQGGGAALELADIGGLSRTEKRALLEPIALWLHERGARGTEVSKAELEQQLAEHFSDLYGCKQGEAMRRAREFVGIIVLHAGLLVERESGVFAFAHLTFQEYLCACALADKTDYWETLQTHLHDPWWREVVLLLGGHLSSAGSRRARQDTAQLLDHILGAESPLEEDLHRDLLLTFRCTCDMEALGLEPARREQLLEAILDLWQQTDIDALRDEIDELFHYAAPTAAGAVIRDRLLSLSEHKEDGIRSHAASALGRLGGAAATTAVLDRLVAMIQDGDDGVRSNAAEGLGRLGAAAATPEVLARLVTLIQEGDDAVRSHAAEALGGLGAATASPGVLRPILLMIKNVPPKIGANLAWACGQAGHKLAEADLEILLQFWRKQLGAGQWDWFCGRYQSLSSAAYKELKHLAVLVATLPPPPDERKSRGRKSNAARPCKSAVDGAGEGEDADKASRSFEFRRNGGRKLGG